MAETASDRLATTADWALWDALDLGDPNALRRSIAIGARSACIVGSPKSLRALLEGGARVDDRSPEGLSPLCFACIQDRFECVQTLLDHGASPNQAPSAGRMAPAALCVLNGSFQSLATLLARVADPITLAALPGAEGETGPATQGALLHLAAWLGELKSAPLLMASGADPRWLDAKGRDAADMALAKMARSKSNGWRLTELAALLRARSAAMDECDAIARATGQGSRQAKLRI